MPPLMEGTAWIPLDTMYQSAGAAITTRHTLAGLNNRRSSPTILEAGNTRSRCRQTGSAPGEGPLPGLQMAAFSLCPHMAERQREEALVTSHKGKKLKFAN